MKFQLVFRRYAPFDEFGVLFEGDKRTEASADLSAMARTIGIVEFGIDGVAVLSAESSGTMLTRLGPKVAQFLGKHHSKVVCSVVISSANSSSTRFTAQSAGSIPLQKMLKVVPQVLVPDIDTFVDISASFQDNSLNIDGIVRGDNYPNAEVIVVDSKLNTKLLFEYHTDGGQETGPFTRLYGAHADQVLGSFSERVPLQSDGSFT